MKSRQYRMPNGEFTNDPDEYGNSWTKIGDDLAEALGTQNKWTWKFVGCNPSIAVAPTKLNSFGGTVYGPQLSFPIGLALHIINMYQNIK